MLTLVLVLSFASCSPGSNTPEKEAEKTTKAAEEKKAEDSTDAPAEEVAKEGERVVTVWCWDPAFNIFAMQEAEKDYNAKHPENPIKLNIVDTPWPDVQAKITAVGTTGQLDQLPDIFLMQDNAFKKNFQFYPDIFADLSESGIDFSQFAASKADYSVIDGKHYGVPFDNGVAINAIRTDLLEEAGYTLADLTDITWDRFGEIGEDILAKTGKPMFTYTTNDPGMVMMTLQSCDSGLFNDDGTPNIVGNQILKDALLKQKELTEKGVIAAVNNWDEYIAGFTNGDVLGTIQGCWILGSVQTSEDQAGKWGVTNMPKLYADDASSTNYSNNGGSSWAVVNNDNKENAMDFLKETFAGSVDFYDVILPSSGAITTYLPAKSAPSYDEPQAFFADQKIYADILTYAEGVPNAHNGVYYYEAVDAIAQAFEAVLNGEDIDTALQTAEDEVLFKME